MHAQISHALDRLPMARVLSSAVDVSCCNRDIKPLASKSQVYCLIMIMYQCA